MNELNKIAEEMANYSDMLVESGLLHLKGGNYSVRLGKDLIITPTKCFKKDLVPEKLLCAKVDSDEEVKNASSVLSMHRAIYRKTDAKAIIHAHPYYASLLSFYIDEIRPLDENGLLYLGRQIQVVAAQKFMQWYEVDEDMANAMIDCPVAILKWHGAFAKGDTLAQAFHNTQALESTARFYWDIWRNKSTLPKPQLPDYIKTPNWLKDS
tara:strand:- start:124 stop:753 length:630 start_codon:yes stop_codon:yes gene_type:complete